MLREKKQDSTPVSLLKVYFFKYLLPFLIFFSEVHFDINQQTTDVLISHNLFTLYSLVFYFLTFVEISLMYEYFTLKQISIRTYFSINFINYI